jgi:hypothetical protein
LTVYINEDSLNTAVHFNQDVKQEFSKALLETGKFEIIDRKSYQAILEELNYQKNEAFIDGKVVQQGRLKGAEYIINLKNEKDAEYLMFEVLSVEKGVKVFSDKVSYKNKFKNLRKSIAESVESFSNSIFLKAKFEVLKILVKEQTSLVLLLKAGHRDGIKEGDKFKLVQVIEEYIGGEVFERIVTISNTGKIVGLESDLFSHIKISDDINLVVSKIESGEKIFVIRY